MEVAHKGVGQEESRLFVLAVVDQRSGQPLRVLTDDEIAHLESQYRINDEVPQECFYCGIEKTPQWRKGPPTASGPAKLCNACGTKYLRSMRKQEMESVAPTPPPKDSRAEKEFILI